MDNDDSKYIVMKSQDFWMLVGELALPPWKDPKTGELVGTDWDASTFAAQVMDKADRMEIKDAVVIRKKDIFSGPALHVYAANIAMSASILAEIDPVKAANLQSIADYFHEQAVDADAVDDKKFPD